MTKELKRAIKFAFHKIAQKLSKLRMREISEIKIPENKNEIRLFCILKNEINKLPYFFNFYRELGVDRFIIIDNSSNDGSLEFCLKQQNTHIFKTTEPYTSHWYWMENMLDDYAINHWCVVVDADEILHYPGIESLKLKQFCQYLESEQSTALRCLLLDMYARETLAEGSYKAGQNPLELCNYFDNEFETVEHSLLNKKTFRSYTTTIFKGGMRKRVFGLNNICISKVPLFKYLPQTYLSQGMHGIDEAEVSKLQGVVFHFKYLEDFKARAVKQLSESKLDKTVENEYKAYSKTDQEFFCQDSVKLESDKQLIDLNMMKTSEEFKDFLSNRIN